MTTIAELERKLTGHKDWVNSVAVSPDGRWVASGSGFPDNLNSKDNTVRVWDLATGKRRATLRRHTDRVRSVIITDGQQILSGSYDNTVRIWDVRQQRQLARIELNGPALSLCPLPDSKRVLIGLTSPKNTIELWSFDGVRIWGERTDGYAECVAIHEATGRALSGHSDASLYLWNLETGENLATLRGHSGIIYSVQITPDGRFAVSGSGDKTIKIWDLAVKRCIGTLEGHQSDVYSIALSRDGGLIASTGFIDGTVRLWDWVSSACLQVIKQEKSFTPISVAFSPDGSRLVVGTVQGPIYIYRLNPAAVSSSKTTPRYVNAKVVLIGEGAVGKTSLAHRLIEDKYVIRDRTHGMNVWRLALGRMGKGVPRRAHHGRAHDGLTTDGHGLTAHDGHGLTAFAHPTEDEHDPTAHDGHGLTAFAHPTEDEHDPTAHDGHGLTAFAHPTEDREALLWDLAGQEDYRLIHRLFLNETALALLLIDPQKDDPFAEAGDWMKSLETAQKQSNPDRKAARLLVFSQVDVGG